jgi:hypothetical protein
MAMHDRIEMMTAVVAVALVRTTELAPYSSRGLTIMPLQAEMWLESCNCGLHG